MTKTTARILLIVLILAMAMLACVGGGGGADGGISSNWQTSSANATATYGAEQFHLQLTAQAQPVSP